MAGTWAAGRQPALRVVPTEPVRFQAPELPPIDAIAAYYRRSEEARFFSNGGPCSQELAARLAGELSDRASVLPVANCTLGLMVAMRAVLGEPRRARRLVITPSYTFTATACAIAWAGFEPLFVDVDPVSWQLCPRALADALDVHGARVAGVLACSSFGSAPPQTIRDGWRAVCRAHDVGLLLDSAAGFGATDERGVRIGGLGEVEVFSFHATKPFAIGEGGAIACGDPEVAARLGRLVNFGMAPGTTASEEIGINAKMSELHAATALAMLDRFEDALGRRRATATAVREALAATGVQHSLQDGHAGSTHQAFQVSLADGHARLRAVRAAAHLGVQARTYFDPPLHRMPAFADALCHGALPVTDQLADRALSLPLANDLPAGAVERIAAVVAAAA